MVTASQHENIAKGIRRIKFACMVAKSYYKIELSFYNPPLTGSFYSNRFKSCKTENSTIQTRPLTIIIK